MAMTGADLSAIEDQFNIREEFQRFLQQAQGMNQQNEGRSIIPGWKEQGDPQMDYRAIGRQRKEDEEAEFQRMMQHYLQSILMSEKVTDLTEKGREKDQRYKLYGDLSDSDIQRMDTAQSNLDKLDSEKEALEQKKKGIAKEIAAARKAGNMDLVKQLMNQEVSIDGRIGQLNGRRKSALDKLKRYTDQLPENRKGSSEFKIPHGFETGFGNYGDKSTGPGGIFRHNESRLMPEEYPTAAPNLGEDSNTANDPLTMIYKILSDSGMPPEDIERILAQKREERVGSGNVNEYVNLMQGLAGQ
jgi:hypothetical protein